jgi:flagellar hook-basal body protein
MADSGDAVTTERLPEDKYLYSVTKEIYTSQGEQLNITFVFEKLDTKTWLWTVRNPVEDPNAPEGLLSGYGLLIFNEDGSFNRYLSTIFQSPSDPATFDSDNGDPESGRAATLGHRGIYIDPPQLGYPADLGGSPPPREGADIIELIPDFLKLTEFADPALRRSDIAISQNGYPMGRLNEITIDKEGIIWANYTNDQQMPKAKIALATFTNPGGLDQVAGTMFAQTANSGKPQVVEAKAIGSEVLSGKLERSNVDLASQFVEMILAERGFMASGRIVTQVDRMVMDLMRMRM